MSELLLPLLSRWVHVGVAIVLVGGMVFMRFALMPAASELVHEAHEGLRERVNAVWKKFVGLGILLLLLSGITNYYFAIQAMKTGAVTNNKLYHPLMGVKMLLAMGVFFIASALTGRAKALENIRRKASLWLGLNILLAAIIVAIAGYLKVAV